MPIAIPRSDRVAQWDPRQPLDSFASPYTLYSGYLLKLGSNDRWQSRLFTFDGVVLSCVGKKSRAPPVSTYDPHVSSPFASNFCHQQPYNPNTKWFLNLSSITDIRLLSSSRTFRCFPYNDVSRSLLIQTIDGRTLTLRAKKDLELERWYFVLSKLWACQQIQFQQQQHSQYQRLHSQHPLSMQAAEYTDKDQDLDHHHQHQHYVAPHNFSPSPIQHNLIPAASLLPAHQQSAHLFNKYLQRQQYHYVQEEYQPEQPHSPQQQHSTHQYHQYCQQQNAKTRESFLQYQIPLPRVSAFLPQGLDWTNKKPDEDEDDEDDEAVHEAEEEDEEDDEEEEDEEVRVFLKTTPHDSTHLPSQSLGWPTVGILEPAKAAAIDMWRRSLFSPLMRDRSRSTRSEESIGLPQAQRQMTKFTPSSRRPSGTKSLDLARVNKTLDENKRKSDKYCTSKDKRESAKDPYVRSCIKRGVTTMSDDNLPLAMVRSRQGSKCHGIQLPVNLAPQQLDTHFSASDSEVEQESPDVCRFTRWQNTQLSSVADTTTNRDSFAALTTPDLNRNSFPSFPNCDSLLNFSNRDRIPCPNVTGNNFLGSRTVTPDDQSISPLDPAPNRFPLTSFSSKSSILQSGKKRILTSILKRPSLPSLDTAVLAEAVSASAASLPLTGFPHSPSGEKLSSELIKPLNVKRESLSTDPSLSLHGSSYSYLPIHDPDFVFSKRANAMDESAYLIPTPPFLGGQDIQVAAQSPMVSEDNTIPLIPPPPARPLRRRPVASRSPKQPSTESSVSPQMRESPSVPCRLFSPTLWTCQESSSPEAPRRNSEPTISLLNMGLGIQLPQMEHPCMLEHNSEISQMDSLSIQTVAAGEPVPQLHPEQAKGQTDLDTNVGASDGLKDIVKKQEQKFGQVEFAATYMNIACNSEEAEDEEIESVLSGEGFCYF
ncbi:hypothetical protein BGZ76_006965 [Entomortierella beljakovae]|nr:hypothetical protein BGZ76_006965 [Entomortierella beljakovae]